MTTKEYLQQAYRLDKRINSHIREKEELKNAIPAHPVLFDISIFDGEKEIEPAEGSSVQVEIKLAKDSVSGLFTDEESPLLINEEPVKATGNELTRKLQIIHDVKEESLEVVDVREKDSEEKITGQFVTESFSNWLLFLDEEVTSIDVYQGDSITLRPYGKWFWKYNDPTNTLSDVSWSFPASQYDVTEDWTQVDVDYNGGKEWRYGITQAKTKNGLYTIYGTAKYDRELKEDYRFFNIYLPDNAPLDGFNLYTSNGKTIRVNVLPKPQTPVTTPPEIQGLTNIKVNLFDYDLGGTLDYGWENGGSNKNLSNRYPTPFTNTINNNSNGPLKFLSSGSGTTQGNYVNYYRGSIPNTGIVDTRLGTDHFPKLAYNRDNQQHSLKYLFDTSKTSVSNWQTYKDIIAYPNVTGLFQKDTDGYYYSYFAA